MAKTGTITLYEGIGKDSKKPYKALKLEIGEWSKLYFVDSRFEMDYIEKHLKSPEAGQTENGRTILDDDEAAF